MENRANIEFDHLERILADVGTNLSMSGTRSARTARAMFEAHLAAQYDRIGCFCYVGWASKEGVPLPSACEQVLIYAAYARGAVAARVSLGALEPNEGFGLATWRKSNGGQGEDPLNSIQSMVDAASCAAGLLQPAVASGQITPTTAGLTSIALGYGLLRGAELFSGKHGSMILDGPKIVETIYGEIPNKCGGIAKGKDDDAKRLFPNPPPLPLQSLTMFWQPWTRIASNRGSNFGPGVPLPDDLLQRREFDPRSLDDELKPFLIGLSLDFAQSRDEYAANPHRARTVVNKVLSDFDALARDPKAKQMFVSPRYGDGVGAVIVIEAKSEAEVKKSEWFLKIQDFCKTATVAFQQCRRLGLRIGMAIELDTMGSAPRLAGIDTTSSPAVEPLAENVIFRARECHAAKNSKPKPIKRATLWFRPDGAVGNDVEVLI